MHSALELPEVLLDIFLWLEADPASLCSAVRTNRRWFDCGTAVLWKRNPPCSALAVIPASRQQLYAAKICSLNFNTDDTLYHESFKDLNFTSLRKVSLDTYRPEDGGPSCVKQYLQPPLEEFLLYGGELDDEVLRHISGTCWRLRLLLIDSPGLRISAESFLEFLSQCVSIQDMAFLYGMERLVTPALMPYFAGRDNLTSLAVSVPITKLLLDQIIEDVPKAFKSLSRLNCSPEYVAVPLLVATVPTLTELTLELSGNAINVLVHIATLTELRALRVVFGIDQKALSRDELLALGKLGKLHSLELEAYSDYQEESLLADNFIDKDFAKLVSHLPRLRFLVFHVQCLGYDLRIIDALAISCPLLETCDMMDPFYMADLVRLRGQTPILPHLTHLFIGALEAPTPAEEFAFGRRDAGSDRIHQLFVHFLGTFSDAMSVAFEEFKRPRLE
ncbi:hypothetical protein GQ53DRAFT_773769 [Thozetella sp. PMI_491]|nr:hypothetical protein GQ53DRAFT_773769 [Thozetella sp. PMI_491]